MSVYQDIFAQLKSQLDGDYSLSTLLADDIIYGNRDAQVDGFPYLLVEPLGITETKATIPKRRWSEPMEIEIRGKVKDSNNYDLILKSYEIFEKVGNAIFSSPTMGGLAVGMEFSIVANTVIGEGVREIVMLLQIHSQTFEEDNR